jgi:hypothetical protein
LSSQNLDGPTELVIFDKRLISERIEVMFKKRWLLLLLAAGSCLTIAMTTADRSGGKSPSRFSKTQTIGDVKYLQVNNLSIPFQNNGDIATPGDALSGPLHGPLGEFPAGSDLHFLFASGFFVSGIVNGELWASGVGAASRVFDYSEGPVGGSAGDPKAKIYVVTAQDKAGSPAYVDWADAVAQGADYVDVDRNGSYDPNVDRPDLLGDHMLWFTINDGTPPGNRRWPNGRIVGMEVHVTAWAFARGGALGNIAFVRFRLFNKGAAPISDMYFTSWHDPDLGEFSDDLVGCDTVLSAGFTYNEGPDPNYGDAPPCFLVDFFQGPIVDGAPSDTARRVLGPNLGVQEIPGKKVLGLSSFTQYIQSDPTIGDPAVQQEARNYMTGLTKDGNRFDPLIRGVGGTAQDNPLFWYSGDPATGAGWLQFGGDDQRMLLNTGPFAMNPGDVQDIVTGFVVGQGNSATNSVAVAKQIDVLAQDVYNNNFDIAGPPPAVKVTARSGKENGEAFIDLLWNAAQQVIDRQQKAGADQQFEGFIVKQFRSSSTADVEGGVENSKIIARFDLANDIGDLYADTDQGRVLMFPAANNLSQSDLDNSSGAHVHLKLTTDAFTNLPFRLGTPYYFGVIGYNVNRNNIKLNEITVPDDDWVAPVASDILENSLTSGLNFISIVPGATENFEVVFSGDAERSDGASDGSVTWEVVDPTKVTGHDYEVSFYEDGGETLWRLIDLNTQQVVLDGQSSQTGDYNFPVVDGIMVRVSGPPLEFKNFIAVANAAGPLSPPSYAAFAFNSSEFPSPSGADRPATNQQTNGSRWGIHTADVGGGFLYSFFLTRVSQGGANWSRIVPYDWEIRFTEAGGYAYDRFVTGRVFKVPFELWRIGINTPDDPSDDVRFVPYVLDDDQSGTFNLPNVHENGLNEHTISGGTDDPYSDWIYWATPDDLTPGDAGYKAWEAAALAIPGLQDDGSFTNVLATDNTMRRIVLVNFNGGSVTDPAYPANLNAPLPEAGTVFRIITNKTNGPADKFRIKTKAPTLANTRALQSANFAQVNVFPNPYLANNPLENPSVAEESFVTFTHLPNKARVRIFTISGKLVRELEKDDSGTLMRWDLRNAFALKVASGLYIVHIEAPDLGMQKVLKVAVIQRESRLQRF